MKTKSKKGTTRYLRQKQSQQKRQQSKCLSDLEDEIIIEIGNSDDNETTDSTTTLTMCPKKLFLKSCSNSSLQNIDDDRNDDSSDSGVPNEEYPSHLSTDSDEPNEEYPSLPLINSDVPNEECPSLPLINSNLTNEEYPSLPLINSDVPNEECHSLPLMDSDMPKEECPSLPLMDSDVPNEEYPLLSLTRAALENREKLVERFKMYCFLLEVWNSVKDNHTLLYRKLKEVNDLYIRNVEAILRLGFCICDVHEQTLPVGELLISLIKTMGLWATKIDDTYEILKEPSQKPTPSAMKLLEVSTEVKGEDKEDPFDDINLPEFVWNLDNPSLEKLHASKLPEEWKKTSNDISQKLFKVEMDFLEISLEYGITRRPERTNEGDVQCCSWYETLGLSLRTMKVGDRTVDYIVPASPIKNVAVADDNADDNCGDWSRTGLRHLAPKCH